MVLRDALSPAARALLEARYEELVGLTSREPDAWILTARAVTSESPPVAATFEIKLLWAGTRAAAVRQRTWP